jgi:SAM-dependent methyltransferase
MTDIGNNGERATIGNTWLYYAHLSIYRFAIQFCRPGARVLDAGSGTGYGSAYLADHGASVLAYDAGVDAVAFAAERFPKVTYEVRDLGAPLPLADRGFDLVFSSNVFEHVANVDCLAAECARIVRPDGAVVVAVPPVTWPGSAESDIRHYFHVHHIPPAAWHAKLSRFFDSVECFNHHGIGKWRSLDAQNAEHARAPDQVTIREDDFEFPSMAVEDHGSNHSITAVFVCRDPRQMALPETLAERMPAGWFTGAIVARIVREEREAADAARAEIDAVRRERDAAQARLDAVLASTSWRVTRILRALRGAR